MSGRGLAAALAGLLLAGTSCSACFGPGTDPEIPVPPPAAPATVPGAAAEAPAPAVVAAAEPDPRHPPTPVPAPGAAWTEVPAAALVEGAADLSARSLATAIEHDLEYLAALPPGQSIAVGPLRCDVLSYRLALEVVRAAAARGEPVGPWVEKYFRAFRRSPVPGTTIATGYFEPVLEARRERSERFRHPIYGEPDDLIEVPLGDLAPGTNGRKLYGRLVDGRLEPYFTRAEIDGGGVLAGRGLEVAWTDDPIDLYFLHVQGSGVLRLGDGSLLRIGYAASNGRPYTSIGRLLLDRGLLAPGEASSPGIARWLRAHPEEAPAVLGANERYVFFEARQRGPLGTASVPLTAGRSIAVDPTVHPLGTLGFLETEIPLLEGGRAVGMRPVRRFVLLQDTGAAIEGPDRVDLFFGTGDAAGLEAGHTYGRGSLAVLIPDCPTAPPAS